MYNWEFITLINGLEPDLRAWAGLFLLVEKRAANEEQPKLSMLTQMMLLLNNMNLCVTVSYLY
jgi:hypothetical protein